MRGGCARCAARGSGPWEDQCYCGDGCKKTGEEVRRFLAHRSDLFRPAGVAQVPLLVALLSRFNDDRATGRLYTQVITVWSREARADLHGRLSLANGAHHALCVPERRTLREDSDIDR